MPNQKQRITVIIQARMTSTRLPGKVLMPINKKPMLYWVISRLNRSKLIDEIVLAIPDTKESNVLEEFAKENDIIYVRGSEDNVLSRYYKAAKQSNADVVVRITADCPLVDSEIVDNVIEEHISSKADYTSNVIERTYPQGLDVEVFNFSVLEKAIKEAETDFQKEHVTPYFLQNPQIFRLHNVTATGVLNNPEIRITVDTQKDLDLVREIYKHFSKKEFFSAKEAVEFIK